ncbi:ABC transporter permease subunit [Roseovarius salis]|uniref:ABC transporter permease n=1 Tax=Roseovarius salis TaxID=3376063 RepID=UPI0037CC349D
MTPRKAFPMAALAWAGVLAGMLGLLAMKSALPWAFSYPAEWVVPATGWLNTAMDWFIDWFGQGFRAASSFLDRIMAGVRWLILALPWSVMLLLITLAAYALSGLRLALFAFLAVLYMAVIGYWQESMNSLSLVALSVPFSILIGFALGAWAFLSDRAERAIRPAMDLLQTIPAFAYLLPILLLFGFGPVVGLIASLLYAVPPMVRNTALGLGSVGTEVIEAGTMSGATPRQLFWRVRVPTARKQLLLGVNQTTMAAFSMVIIASIIGGTADIGWEVLSSIRRAEFGQSLIAGLVIALMAMVMDRITGALAAHDAGDTQPGAPHGRMLWLAVLLAAVLLGLAQVFPALADYPKSWVIFPAETLNAGVEYLVVEFSRQIEAIKQVAFFYVMLPVKLGLAQTISPFSWGFAFTDTMKAGYAVAAAALAVLGGWRLGWKAAVAIVFCATLLFFGLTGLPWPALMAAAVLAAYQLGGWRLAAGMGAGLGFLLVCGVWAEAMLSLYLCGLAVFLCFLIGGLIGVLASENDAVSAAVRPVNDTLQTMPLFVLLIPFVMIFKIGEFTALLAIMAYAIVPSIRYTEHGLRNVPAESIEAAICSGCTRWQLLWRVKFPLAAPVIFLGLNQTIMYAIAMLVIAALVGTNGLGQQVYIGLGDGDFGVGMVAGIGMAIIAMLADRMTQALSGEKQATAP